MGYVWEKNIRLNDKVLRLNNEEVRVFKDIDKKTIKYSIRKAQKAGVKIVEENTMNGIEEFYRLSILTRKKHGVPSQPKIFFLNLYKYVILKGLGSIYLALSDSEVIASGFF